MFCLRDERSHSGVGAYPPLEGEGRLTLSAAKCETGWGDGLSTPAPLETRDCHPTPPLISFASTLPLQGRVKEVPKSASPHMASTPVSPPDQARPPRNSNSAAFTSAGRSCCTQWPAPSIIRTSRR